MPTREKTRKSKEYESLGFHYVTLTVEEIK
jgi:hypothetical protein